MVQGQGQSEGTKSSHKKTENNFNNGAIGVRVSKFHVEISRRSIHEGYLILFSVKKVSKLTSGINFSNQNSSNLIDFLPSWLDFIVTIILLFLYQYSHNQLNLMKLNIR